MYHSYPFHRTNKIEVNNSYTYFHSVCSVEYEKKCTHINDRPWYLINKVLSTVMIFVNPSVVILLKYCRYGVKHYSINQSINQFYPLLQHGSSVCNPWQLLLDSFLEWRRTCDPAVLSAVLPEINLVMLNLSSLHIILEHTRSRRVLSHNLFRSCLLWFALLSYVFWIRGLGGCTL